MARLATGLKSVSMAEAASESFSQPFAARPLFLNHSRDMPPCRGGLLLVSAKGRATSILSKHRHLTRHAVDTPSGPRGPLQLPVRPVPPGTKNGGTAKYWGRGAMVPWSSRSTGRNGRRGFLAASAHTELGAKRQCKPGRASMSNGDPCLRTFRCCFITQNLLR